MLKVTFFGTTTLLFDDGKDQVLFDAHVTRPSLVEYFRGAKVSTNIPLCDELIRPSFNYIERQLDGLHADILFLGVAGLAKADPEMEKTFFSETVEKVSARLVIPVHWDNFFSPLDQPIKGMPDFIEKTGQVFFKLANYCESHDVNFLIQYPRTSIVL